MKECKEKLKGIHGHIGKKENKRADLLVRECSQKSFTSTGILAEAIKNKQGKS